MSPHPPHPPDFPRPLVTVDVVIFTVLGDALQVLLVRRPSSADVADEPFAHHWALPGGFVDVHHDATLLDCALRKLREKTGVATPYLEQLGSWGSATRDPRGWSATHCFYALIPAAAVQLETGGNAGAAQWLGVDAALDTPLAFDHHLLLATALARLRSKVEYTSLPAFLLDEPFTLPALQRTFEVVLARSIDKSAFRKRMLDGQFMEEAGVLPGAQGRPAVGYRLRDRSQATLFPRPFSANGADPATG
ncbi:MAG: NUDIX domain-containing protein [Rhodoferax sp.]|uniref:NrtR DNA-binding winged helix domain-containing protein n=1 Tax=Rhodoferax sp. TaxID=50421 RepID=UPI003267AFBC